MDSMVPSLNSITFNINVFIPKPSKLKNLNKLLNYFGNSIAKIEDITTFALKQYDTISNKKNLNCFYSPQTSMFKFSNNEILPQQQINPNHWNHPESQLNWHGYKKRKTGNNNHRKYFKLPTITHVEVLKDRFKTAFEKKYNPKKITEKSMQYLCVYVYVVRIMNVYRKRKR